MHYGQNSSLNIFNFSSWYGGVKGVPLWKYHFEAVNCRLKSTYRLSINGLYWFAAAVQAAVHVGGVLPIKPEKTKVAFGQQRSHMMEKFKECVWDYSPVQVVGGLVQERVILSDKLSPDQLGTWLLHHHFFGQLEICGEEEELGSLLTPRKRRHFKSFLSSQNFRSGHDPS